MEDQFSLSEKNLDKQAIDFEQLVKQYNKMVFTVAFRILRNKEDAADATQEAFIKAYKAIDTFRQESKFSTWVCSIVTNICYDLLRKRKNKKTQPLYYTNDEQNEIPLPDRNHNIDPLKMSTTTELREQLTKIIVELDSDYREIVILRELEGFSYQEISKELQISIGTVKSRLSRARQEMVKKLQEKPELLPYDLRHKE